MADPDISQKILAGPITKVRELGDCYGEGNCETNSKTECLLALRVFL